MAVDGLAVHGRIEGEERIERQGRPVRAERDDASVVADRRPRPGLARPLRADGWRPYVDLVGARIGVVGLHRGDDAELPEPRDVIPGDGLDVLDPVAAVTQAIGGRGTFVRIE